MQAEIDACTSLDQLQILWNSPQFRAAYEQLPNDWKKLIVERKEQAKADLSAPKGYVPPVFKEEPSDNIPY